MDYSKAIKILELQDSKSEIQLSTIKKQYHKLALWYHPDKNNNSETSKIQFQELNEAYHYLSNKKDDSVPVPVPVSFSSLLTKFIHIFFHHSENKEIVHSIIHKIIHHFETISVHIFDDLNK